MKLCFHYRLGNNSCFGNFSEIDQNLFKSFLFFVDIFHLVVCRVSQEILHLLHYVLFFLWTCILSMGRRLEDVIISAIL